MGDWGAGAFADRKRLVRGGGEHPVEIGVSGCPPPLERASGARGLAISEQEDGGRVSEGGEAGVDGPREVGTWVTLGKAQGQVGSESGGDGWEETTWGWRGGRREVQRACQAARLGRAQRCPQRPIQYTVKEEPRAAVGPRAPKGVCAPVLS